MPSSHTNIQRGYADISSGQIHYRLIETNSDRRPVLLLHPSPLSSIVWDGFMTALSRDRTVVAPDTPGFGESSPPASEPEIADYATAMADLLSVLKLGSIDVMGYHTGSLTAVELARLKPDLVHSIVMISATIFTDEERDGFRAQYTPKTLDQKGEALAETWSFMKTFWRDEPEPDRRWDIFLEGQRHHTYSHWGHQAAFNYDLSAALSQSLKPIFILNPEDDLWDYTPRAAGLLHNGRVHDLPGWTHGFLDAHSDEVADLVRNFLDHKS